MKKTRLNLLLSGLLLAIPAAFGGVDDEYLALRRSVGDGHFEEALRRSMSLIRQYPGYLYFYETLAEVAHYAQKDSLALQEFEERIEDGTELGLAYYGLGVTCCNLKNYQSAVLCFTKAIDAGNVTAECHRRFEMAYEKMEGIDAAISYFNLLCRRDWALPVMAALYTPKDQTPGGKRHKTPAVLARQMLQDVRARPAATPEDFYAVARHYPLARCAASRISPTGW